MHILAFSPYPAALPPNGPPDESLSGSLHCFLDEPLNERSNKQAGKQTGKQAGKQADRQTGRLANRQSGRPASASSNGPVNGHSRASAFVLGVVFITFFLSLCSFTTLASASTSANLRQRISQEEAKAKKRKDSLKRLTQQERTVNANLARSEKRVAQLEKNLDSLRAKLKELSVSDTQAEEDYKKAEAEQARTVAVQQELLRLLWQIQAKRESIGSRDMLDWDATDREFSWSVELLSSLDSYQKQLLQQQKELQAILSKRTRYAKEVEENLAKANAEKDNLLQAQLSYNQELGKLRSQKEDAEAELKRVLQIVDDLNLELSKVGTDIQAIKGNVNWPVQGKKLKGFAPKANPPHRGIAFSAPEGSPVTAVATGKVVHNDILRGFGTVLILQHDSSYYSLYAFLGKSPMKVGTQAKRGQQIGSVGYYPAIEASGMYFELRHKQQAVNPEPWFKK